MKGSGKCTISINSMKQNQFAGFSKLNYHGKIDKNKRKNIKITKIDC